ncbi:Xyloglucan galactosyltransferase xlt2 [Dionaea muscipula]
MLPISDACSSPDHHRHHPLKKPCSPPADHDPNTPTSVLPFSSASCLIISILFLQTLFLLFSPYLPFSLHSHHHHHHSHAATTTTLKTSTPQCEFGRIFVYDLPPMFNAEIYRNCDKLNPWSSRCEALSNDGFGPPATGLSQLVPRDLLHAWFWTDQFASEIIFHRRILHHRCRTLEAESAAAYYIPFYAGLEVAMHLWPDVEHFSSVKDRDRECEMMLDWIQRQKPFFNRSKGWDHFITMGRISWDFRRKGNYGWGSRCIVNPSMGNITRLLIERNPWDYFDIGIPYPTGFHPTTDSDVVRWQDFVRSRDRRTLFCFAGTPRSSFKNDFRGILMSQCQNESGSCRVVDCAGFRCDNGTSEVLETFLDSVFCLQPRGDSFTRRSVFDCMVAGSIPVFFWKRTAYLQYNWFLPGEPEVYSVFIHHNEVKNGTSIRRVLEGYGEEKVRKMREKVIESIPRLVYSKTNNGLESIHDAFDVAIDGVMKRIKLHRDKGYNWK